MTTTNNNEATATTSTALCVMNKGINQIDANNTKGQLLFRKHINATTSMTKQQLDNEIERLQLKLEALLDAKTIRDEGALPSKFRFLNLLPTELKIRI